ncbi:hypothetical protein SAMN05444395_1159 [Flavobacterium fryxellicola]|uniref:Uncharacterized protein n=1 Tax=Flavobacterium fryxellicola TaxID=249352 RepID=A0A167WH38_9FLAO|nr:hypothetical protein [Flavobacterium fryxellicola]OAB27383.1 hypothetical protein FBFR_11160 [Flavobacterium fryxellicola]SHN79005.1 hypothetical protein SAMN05444395_1159 [Flavobacterium fryxellicola]
MKKYYSIILLISIINLGSSQVKKRLFYNENKVEITELNFYKQKNPQKNLGLYFENDTIALSLLIKRKNDGQLNDSIFKNLKKSLSADVKLTNELMVMVYHPGKDQCNSTEIISEWNIFDADYLKKLKRIGTYNHFWIYKDDENLKYYHPTQVKWEQDNNQLIEKLFFKNHYPCFSAVVIDKKGKYSTYFGEFGKTEIWELAKELMEEKN